MVAYWETEDAKKKSARASKARKSERGGLGISKHVGGPKSNARHQQEMSIELGREVSIAEVFIKTHTRKDGTFVDEKAKLVSEVYEKNVESALSQSGAPELTAEQQNVIFLKSTVVDGRGNPFGLGRLSKVYGKPKKKAVVGTSSVALVALEDQLKEAQTKLEEQASLNSQYKSQMDLMMKYMTEKDPTLPMWIQSQVGASSTTAQTIPPTATEESSSDSEDSDEDVEDGEDGDVERGQDADED